MQIQVQKNLKAYRLLVSFFFCYVLVMNRFVVDGDFLKHFKLWKMLILVLYVYKSLNDIRWYYMGLCNPIRLYVSRWFGHIKHLFICVGTTLLFCLRFNMDWMFTLNANFFLSDPHARCWYIFEKKIEKVISFKYLSYSSNYLLFFKFREIIYFVRCYLKCLR